jgi:tyrosyl-tRNA synthetase
MRISSICKAAAKYDTFAVLKNRSLIHQCTDENNLRLSLSKCCVAYTGFDPTAQSLHVGNLLTIVSLMHFWAGGHKIIALIGGATGAIGDPSGKSKERVALDGLVIENNSNHIEKQLHQLFNNTKAYLKRRHIYEDQSSGFSSLNNLNWIGHISLIDFLQTIGRKVRISAMLAKDSVQGRMNEGEGISFSEFSYQLLQAYDFLYLHNNHDCKIQLGGSDQYGNITAGLDLIRKSKADPKEATNAFGITIPLVTTASGKKFGKSEGNAIWLDSSLLSVFDFYQFFRRSSDEEVEKLLTFFTFLSEDAIADIMNKHKVKLRK